MTGYDGSAWPSGLPWRAPSPNLPRLASALLYPLTVCLEGTVLSEGRGTDAPFEQVGAPWLDGEALARVINEQPGVRAEPVQFTPNFSKHEGAVVSGVKLARTGPFDPLRSARVLLTEARRQDPERFGWLGPKRPFVDLLAGSDVLRRTVSGEVSEDDFEAWLETGEKLEPRRVKLYDRRK